MIILYQNKKNGKTRAHLFQDRFYSCPLDSSHFLAAARYVERNPVRARLCKQAEEYPWSSARFHLDLTESDPLIRKKYEGIGRCDQWADWLSSDPCEIEELRRAFRIGRPLRGKSFIKQAELTTGRASSRKKAGRPKKERKTHFLS